MKYSVIIPVFNGETTLIELFSRIQLAFKHLMTQEYEVIFVHDYGSVDSWNIIKALETENKDFVKCIKLTRNFGQHNAIISGITNSTGNFIITMDEDLQQDPLDILLLIDKQQTNDFDVIYGVYEFSSHTTFRRITSNLLKTLLRVGIPELNQNYSPFRLIKREIAFEITKMNNSYTFLDGYIMWITNNIDFCLVKHNPRKEGRSSYTTKKLIKHSLNIFFTFSDLPIKFLIYLSISIFFLTAIYSSFIVVSKLLGKVTAPGYSSIIITSGIGIGCIMLGLGIVGEYLYRINLKTTKRPNFFYLKDE